MIDVTTWMHNFLQTLNETFANRVWFVGLQGRELLRAVSFDERIVVETFLNLKKGGTVDFDSMSETLFTWSKKWISENS